MLPYLETGKHCHLLLPHFPSQAEEGQTEDTNAELLNSGDTVAPFSFSRGIFSNTSSDTVVTAELSDMLQETVPF